MNETHKKRTGAILFALLLAAGIWFATRPANPPPDAQPPAQAAAPAAQAPAAPAVEPPTPAPTSTEPAAETSVTKTIQAARPQEPSSAPRAKKQGTAADDSAALSEKTSKDTEAKPSEPEAVAEMAPTAEPATAPPPAAPAAKPPPPPVTAPFVAHFRNRAGNNLRIVRVTCTLDGATVCNTAGSGNDFTLFSRAVDQGPHTLNVLVEYQGDSAGFSYFKGYRYRVGDSRRFNIVSSASKGMTVTAYERGGPTTPFEERLAVSIR